MNSGDQSEKNQDISSVSTQDDPSEPDLSDVKDVSISDSGTKTYNVFVGDLRSNVTESDLEDAFKACGEIDSVHVIRDKVTRNQKGYGFVHFKSPEGRQKALNEPFCNQDIKGRACRVNLPEEKKNTLWVGGLPLDLGEQDVLRELQSLLPNTISISEIELKTGPAPDYSSRGFAFVSFESHDAADQGRKIFTSSSIKGSKLLNVSWAEPKREVDESVMKTVKTLFVSNLHNAVNEDQLHGLFLQFGDVKSCTIVKDAHGDSKGFAFIEYHERKTCELALEKLKGVSFCGLPLEIQFAKPPQEKESSGRSMKYQKQDTSRTNRSQRNIGPVQRSSSSSNVNRGQTNPYWGLNMPYNQAYGQNVGQMGGLQGITSTYNQMGSGYGQQYYQQYGNVYGNMYGQSGYGQGYNNPVNYGNQTIPPTSFYNQNYPQGYMVNRQMGNANNNNSNNMGQYYNQYYK